MTDTELHGARGFHPAVLFRAIRRNHMHQENAGAQQKENLN
jgi:hypothetical protein